MSLPKTKLSVDEVMAMYPTEDACLAALFRYRFGPKPRCRKCGLRGEFFRKWTGPSFECRCGFEIAPMARTPAHNTNLPLRSWLWVMTTLILEGRLTRDAVTSKLGVSQVTASRMIDRCRAWIAIQGLRRK